MAKSLGSKYLVQEALGHGAMGQVFAGSIRPTGEPVAIKILRPELVSDPEVVARFVQERKILMSITDPHVVQVIDLVVEGDTLAIVMELIRGSDLRRQLRAQGTLPPAQAVQLTGQLLRGAAAVHAAGIVHRDIKPENVLVDTSTGQPRLKLTDFGVARLSFGGSLTKVSGLIGTPEYMAPELAEDSRATPAADVYSAAIVLYELLCGRTPFAGGHPVAVLRRHADQAPPVIPGVPSELWDRIAWMLGKDPGSRPSSAAEAYHALAPLEGLLATQPALAPWAGPESQAPAQTAAPVGHSLTAPGRAGLEDSGGAVPGGTVLRHRDRGELPVPAGAGGPAPRPGKRSALLNGPQLSSAPSSRRKWQAGLAVVAVAVVAVLGLATAVAMARTHRPATPVRSAADGQTAAVSSASRPVPPTGTGSATASASAGALGGTPGAAVAPDPVSATTATPGGDAGHTTPAVIIETQAGSTKTVTASATASTTSHALTAAQQQLASSLSSSLFDNCTGRTDVVSVNAPVAINCSAVLSGPSLRPLIETLASGHTEIWFQNNTSGYTNTSSCANGGYVGGWSHNGVTEGRVGCTVEANGLLRIVWYLDGGQVGIIAEGPDHQAMYNWWKSTACAVPGAC